MNDIPIIGNIMLIMKDQDDMYYKGGNMLNTIRQIVNDDDKWRDILRGLNKDFYHQVVKGSQIENYLSEKTGLNLKPVFDQYLRDIRIPVFEYYIKENNLSFRWNNCVTGFIMPLKIWVSGKVMDITPKEEPTIIKLDSEGAVIKVDPDYYVGMFINTENC